MIKKRTVHRNTISYSVGITNTRTASRCEAGELIPRWYRINWAAWCLLWWSQFGPSLSGITSTIHHCQTSKQQLTIRRNQSLIQEDTGVDNETFMDVDGDSDKMSVGMTVINVVCTLVSSGIMFADSVAIYVLLKCKRIPTYAHIFSINFFLSDAIGSAMLVACQVSLLILEINVDVMHHIRSLLSGFALTVAMPSVALLALDRALALKLSLRYKVLVSKTKGLCVAIALWCFNIITMGALLCYSAIENCSSEQICELWSVTQFARFYLTVIVVVSQVFVTLSYFYVLKVARKHQNALQAMKTMTNNPTSMVSERQFETTKTLLRIILAFIICYTPLCVQMVLLETNVAARNDFTRRILLLVTYIFIQVNSIVNLKIYVARFKECKMVLMMLADRFCQGVYTQQIEDLRINVFNIVVTRDDLRHNSLSRE